jgi:hypothetical protein
MYSLGFPLASSEMDTSRRAWSDFFPLHHFQNSVNDLSMFESSSHISLTFKRISGAYNVPPCCIASYLKALSFSLMSRLEKLMNTRAMKDLATACSVISKTNPGACEVASKIWITCLMCQNRLRKEACSEHQSTINTCARDLVLYMPCFLVEVEVWIPPQIAQGLKNPPPQSS